MIFEHLESLAVAMECRACCKYAAEGMHRGTDGHWRHPHCCPAPACVAKYGKPEPLADGEIKPVEGKQGGLWE